jgi:hypothetical protein
MWRGQPLGHEVALDGRDRTLRALMSVRPPSAPRSAADAPATADAAAIGWVRAGARLDRHPGPKYAARLHFAELAPAEPLPRAATLARWRQACPPSMTLALVAPRRSVTGARGPLRFDDDLERGFAWLAEARAALGASLVVIPTTSALTTGQRDRDLLAVYVERLRMAAPGATLVWAPTGLWEPDEAARQARALGIVAAFDPLEASAPAGPVAYARLEAVGARTRFGESLLRAAVATLAASEATERYVAIASARSFEEACRLTDLARVEARLEAARPGGTVVGPEQALDDDLDLDDDSYDDEPGED